MRSQGTAHRVEINGNAGSHNDWLSMKISQTARRSDDNEDADKNYDGSYHTAFGAVIAAGHPDRTYRITLNDW